MSQICYRSLRKYKYQLMKDYELKINLLPEKDILKYKFLSLSKTGRLFLKKGYAWDGPSGPTIDTRNFMRGSLVHDALYQLMNLGELDDNVYRKRADEILREICLEDGMWPFRAWYVYWGVRLFGGFFSGPKQEPEVVVICAPEKHK